MLNWLRSKRILSKILVISLGILVIFGALNDMITIVRPGVRTDVVYPKLLELIQ